MLLVVVAPLQTLQRPGMLTWQAGISITARHVLPLLAALHDTSPVRGVWEAHQNHITRRPPRRDPPTHRASHLPIPAIRRSLGPPLSRIRHPLRSHQRRLGAWRLASSLRFAPASSALLSLPLLRICFTVHSGIQVKLKSTYSVFWLRRRVRL